VIGSHRERSLKIHSVVSRWGRQIAVTEELDCSPGLCRRRLIFQCFTVITTFPFLCPCSTYLNASEIRSRG
jgi:hypothetical protein